MHVDGPANNLLGNRIELLPFIHPIFLSVLREISAPFALNGLQFK